ncbi:MAG: nitrate reductase subunit alpha [bacterium]
MPVRTPFGNLRYLKALTGLDRTLMEKVSGGWAEVRSGQREWEDFYRRRWQHDHVVRSTHGVNCTGSCSWNVYVKDGIVVWETQKVDYPSCGSEMPDHEPRGCPRGATYSWYIYSPARVRYPYMRSALYGLWQDALRAHQDPIAAWESIVSDPEKAGCYKSARGQGGLVRVSWDEALDLVAASLVYTIKKHGPDRVFGFTPIPAMSMVSYASGARFLSLIGASVVSFYDWYCDLPPASPQVWGDQTDVPESADWYESTYMIVWGTNLPMTRSPDAHFYTEARYRGAKVVAVAPDYAEYVKFADAWLPAKAGTDGALAMAMTHVILKEFYLERSCEAFVAYAKRYTDLPFLVTLERRGGRLAPDRFLRASDIGPDEKDGEWKTVLLDALTGAPAVPNGSIGFRWNEKGLWNLELRDASTGKAVDPLLSLAGTNDGWELVTFPLFETGGPTTRTGAVPVKRIAAGGRTVLAATVFDLMVAHVGIDRGRGGEAASSYDDPVPYTPAWQEAITGVAREAALRVAREFADNAEKTGGKSMIFLGAGTNHWYHSDMIYRTILNLTTLCGCQGVNGGGWAHYVGQEKVRPLAGWTTVAFGLDWSRPPRFQNGTSFFYFVTDQWRYDTFGGREIASPLAGPEAHRHNADFNVIAARLGWLPAYPQFDRNPLEICREAVKSGAASDEEIVRWVVAKLKSGEIRFAYEDPDAPGSFPRVLFLWRANLLGASGKGHEYFLKHLLGCRNAVFNTDEGKMRPREIVWRDPAPEGKLDLLVTLEMRMSTSALYADVVLPSGGWYEMHDLSSTDLHPFLHPFNPAVDPPWEARTNWDQFRAVAERFSRLAAGHLGIEKDLVATALMHDTPDELAQPLGRVRDWKNGEVEPVPGKTLPNLAVLSRDYPNTYKKMTALGPLVREKGVGAKGVSWKADAEYEELKGKLGAVAEPGISQGMPELRSGKQVAETILALSPESNGRTAVKAWKALEGRTGRSLTHLAGEREFDRMTFADLTAQPRTVITSPTWSGSETAGRRYSPFTINIEEKIPFRTLTGRAQLYQDHEWMLSFGEALPLYRPPLDMRALGSTDVRRDDARELVLNYLTPHSKWSIHSTYSETPIMLTLFRGGEAIWINRQDAEALEVADGEWLECFNVNGLVMAKAVVSHRIPRGKAFMYHAQERLINIPGSRRSGQRGGTHNSVTRILVKPTQMIGGYAHLSYGFNYYGPTGAQRDEVIVVRKAGEVDWYED